VAVTSTKSRFFNPLSLDAVNFLRGSGRYNLAQGAIATVQGIGASLSGLAAGVIVDHFGYSAASSAQSFRAHSSKQSGNGEQSPATYEQGSAARRSHREQPMASKGPEGDVTGKQKGAQSMRLHHGLGAAERPRFRQQVESAVLVGV
jgi:hypothetical protein